jgi:hypothetical protein
MLWQILVQFLFRLALGLVSAMAWTSTRDVTAGFFRVHLWVALGLDTFLAAIVWMVKDYPQRGQVLTLAIVAAVMSYVGAIVWLYEKKTAGWWLLVLIAAIHLGGLATGLPSTGGGRPPGTADTAASLPAWILLDRATSALLLGFTFAAMLLGHWYLNTPSMKLEPLKKLVLGMALLAVVRGLMSGWGIVNGWSLLAEGGGAGSLFLAFLAIRWLAGIAGLLGLCLMTWETLRIPNTQSATGILYVAVILSFLGELTSQFISSQTIYPI